MTIGEYSSSSWRTWSREWFESSIERVARKELPVRIRVARRDGDVTALAAYGALHAVLRTTALARRVPSAVRDSVRPLRRRLGRLRRRVR